MKKIYSCFLIVIGFFGISQDQVNNYGNLTIFNTASVSVFGNFANNGSFTDSSLQFAFSGSTAQVISGTVNPTFNKLTINNTNGVSLQQAISVQNALVLTSGKLDLNSNIISINNSSPTAIIRVSGFIMSEKTNHSSRIKWQINSATGTYVYPFGTAAGAYIPFSIKLLSGNIGNVTVSTYPTAANNTPYPVWPDTVSNVKNMYGLDNSLNTVDRFWQIDKDGIGGVADVAFTATPAEVGTILSLKAQRWNTATKSWDGPLPGQLVSAYSVTVPGVSNFSPWALSGNGVLLPIELVEFNAEKKEEAYVNVVWNTESEVNCKQFTVERSVDAIEFEDLATIEATGGLNAKQTYSLNDQKPYMGVSYYRLRETGFDGSVKYHNMVPVNFEKKESFEMAVFPNPCNGESFTLKSTVQTDEVVEISIRDASGRVCYTDKMNSDNNVIAQEISLVNKLKPGIYLVSINTRSNKLSKRLVVY